MDWNCHCHTAGAFVFTDFTFSGSRTPADRKILYRAVSKHAASGTAVLPLFRTAKAWHFSLR